MSVLVNKKSNANLIHLGLPTRKTQKSQTQMSHVHQNGRKLICTNLVLLIGRLQLQIFHKRRLKDSLKKKSHG